MDYIMKLMASKRSQRPSAKPMRIVDLAAGTGKLTRALIEAFDCDHMGMRNFSIEAVEPIREMRQVFASLSPTIPIHAGKAGQLTMYPNESVDAIVVGQAFHWFATPEALGEIARVLTWGGHLILIWNTRDRGFSKKLHTFETEIDGYYDLSVPRQQTEAWKDVFNQDLGSSLFSQPLQTHLTRWNCRRELGHVMADVMSISGIAERPEREKQEIYQKLYDLLRDTGQTTTDVIDFPYLTETYSCIKL